MCNKYRSRLAIEALLGGFPDLAMPGGLPNLEPREEINITDRAPVVRACVDGRPELSQLRWSWPGPGGRPVYNFRSEGRRFAQGRCLIPCDGFYEFTAPPPDAPSRSRKARWLFTLSGEPWFCVAGVVRARAAAGEDAFAMLTTAPGPDIAPYHDRQVVVMARDRWRAWLEGGSEEELLAPSPAGTLEVARA